MKRTAVISLDSDDESSTALWHSTRQQTYPPTRATQNPANAPVKNSYEDEIACIDQELEDIQSQIDALYEKKADLEVLRHQLLEAQDSQLDDQRAPALSITEYAVDFPWTPKLKQLAKHHWGIDEFRPHQLEIMNAILSKRDVFVIMPTGGGKSLCFQLPALVSDGLTVVISPLVSLIRDQVLCLEDVGISAAALLGSTSKEETKRIQDAMLGSSPKAGRSSDDGSLKIVYVTPEKVAKSKRFISQLEKVYKAGRLTSIVIDEAHCCSQYGHDFRPDYKRLGMLRQHFPSAPIMALSATCPPHLLQNVIQMLNLKPPTAPNGTLLFQSSLHRPNLRYMVKPKPASAAAQIEEMAEWIGRNHRDECGIVYCLSKKETVSVAEGLVGAKLKVGVYHADVEDFARDDVHTDWRSGKVKVVVATIAFGMGINQPNVRFVIHHTMSKSVEGYYQESGRAGRDNLSSDCLLYYRPQDLPRLTSMVVNDHDGLKNVYGMAKYAETLTNCRRTLMEKYFGSSSDQTSQRDKTIQWGDSSPESCGNCDVCLRGEEDDDVKVVKEDVTKEVLSVLKILKALRGEEEKVTLIKVVEAWRGVGKKYGCLVALATEDEDVRIPPPKSVSKDDCERILIRLLLDNYLKEEFHFTPYQTVAYLSIAPRGERAVNSGGRGFRYEVEFLRRKDGKRAAVKRKAKSSDDGDAKPTEAKRRKGASSNSQKEYFIDDVDEVEEDDVQYIEEDDDWAE